MKPYKEFQFGWWIFILMIPIQIYLAYTFFYNIGDKPLDKSSYLIANGTFVLIYLLFYGMTTTIEKGKIKITFGLGLIRKTIETNKIKNIYVVTNPWFYGWGIRLIPNGWLYNISGSNGIELKFNDRERVIRIGTKDPAQLKNEIDKLL